MLILSSIRARRGFTIVELMVVIAIIGVLVGLLLPAVQAARESARGAACRSNLRQVAIGVLLFEETHREFPQGGWGSRWVGVAGRGFGESQPGGWVYRVAPYVDEVGLGNAASPTDTSYLTRAAPVFACPSRRGAQPLPVGWRPHQLAPLPGGPRQLVVRGDYAINSGATGATPWLGPTTLALGDSPTYWRTVATTRDFSGISHVRTSAKAEQVADGLSSTYLLGEKFVPPRHYESGLSKGDDDTLYSGYDLDNHRFVRSEVPGAIATVRFYPPHQDYDAADTVEESEARFVGFGSPHPSGVAMAMGDGSVQTVSYDIDPAVHAGAGHRDDGG
jgi:prepilin-type N-terminal cleavage/methylation domain-containing protein